MSIVLQVVEHVVLVVVIVITLCVVIVRALIFGPQVVTITVHQVNDRRGRGTGCQVDLPIEVEEDPVVVNSQHGAGLDERLEVVYP